MVCVVQWGIMNRVRQFILGRITKNLTQPHSILFPTAKILFLPLYFSGFGLPGGCFFYQSIDQDVKAAHALRERYAPPMQSNFRVSAVLRFQRKVCRAWLERVGRWLVGVRKKKWFVFLNHGCPILESFESKKDHGKVLWSCWSLTEM